MNFKTFISNIKSIFTKDITADPFTFYNYYSQSGGPRNPYKDNATIYSVINAIADNIGQAELAFFDWNTNKEIYPEELMNLFKKPNPCMTLDLFLEAIIMYLMLFNEVIIVKTLSVGNLAGTTKLPAELWVFNPKKFSVINDDPKNPIWQYNGQNFTKEEIIHIHKWNPTKSEGYNRPFSPIDPMRKELDIDYQGLAFNEMFFRNGGKPSYIMSTDKPLSDAARKQLRADWEANYKGVSKAGKLAIFDNGLKFEETGTTHADMQYIEQRDKTKETILGIWRVPKVILSMTSDIHYATFQGQMKAFWLYTLQPCLKRVASELNLQLINPYDPKIELRFKYDNVSAFAEDLKDKISIAKDLKDLGFPLNEINDKLNLGFNPQPWGDEWWMPMGVIPASQYNDYMSFGNDVPENDNDKKQHKIILGKSASEKYDMKVANMFIQKHRNFELMFQPKIKGFFFNMRSKILELIAKGEFNPDSYFWNGDKEKITRIMQPLLKQIITAGVDFGNLLIPSGKGINKGIEEDINNAAIQRSIAMKGIVDTVEKQIKKKVAEMIVEGSTVSDMVAPIRQIFNVASSRALMIARTESTGALNNGTYLYWQGLNIYGKKWLSYFDESTRESHKEIHGQIRSMNEPFSNGLMYPGDNTGVRSSETAKEVINCRCTLSPVTINPNLGE